MANHLVHHRKQISAFNSFECLGGVLWENAGYASATWPAANEAILIPFRVPYPVIAKQMFCSNGAAVSGNLDIGIYTKDGTLLVSTGETAQSGTSDFQTFDITDTLLNGPDWYYMALVLDNTTGTFIRNSASARDWKRFGVASVASDACPLPASATLAVAARAYAPEMGISYQAVI